MGWSGSGLKFIDLHNRICALDPLASGHLISALFHLLYPDEHAIFCPLSLSRMPKHVT